MYAFGGKVRNGALNVESFGGSANPLQHIHLRFVPAMPAEALI